ncbi:methyl-accepting chemotaxis protein [Shewanella mesophila]|uniref:methyl-accepting chemotaxis protein n=1 Tax=Shewanella mesophila TaxID=2864208 RepID=UPI001C66234D|nr:methyl-accepting chemotaxis protein [Shewanella mesophila]QYJ85326.1 methyl-accepting chemotaxis protein [Shewanella mesophila]
MHYLSNLKIKTRLAAGFGCILSLMVLLNILGINQVNFIDRTLSVMTDINSVKQRYAINYRGSVHDRAIAIRDISLARTPAEIGSFEREIARLENFYKQSQIKMDEMLSRGIDFSSEERRILGDIKDIQARTEPIIQQILQDKKQGLNMTDVVLNQARPAFIEWLNRINEFIDYQETQNQQLTPKARDAAGGFENLMLWLTAFALVVSVIIGITIERSLRNSLGGEPFEAESTLKVMTEGDLTESDKGRPKSSVLGSLYEMRAKLTQIVRNIIGASDSLSVQVSEVSQESSMVLSAALQQGKLTSDTAYKLENMRDSIDQISQLSSLTESNSEKTAENARHGSQLVSLAAQEMEKIASTVNSAVMQLSSLKEKTEQIGGVANVINDISEQTNLLALNAAIEAARAGESGRGFAVVADEVRQLAKRTSEATTQIENMVVQIQSETAESVQAMETAQPQVIKGQEQITQATDILQSIEEQAADSLDRIREVALSTTEQVSVVGDVASAMEQISAMSTSTINAMQSNEKAVESLNKLASQLRGEVAYFKVQ